MALFNPLGGKVLTAPHVSVSDGDRVCSEGTREFP